MNQNTKDPPKHYVTGDSPRPARKVSLAAAVGAVVMAVIITALATFGLVVMLRDRAVDVKPSTSDAFSMEDAAEELITIDKLFRSLSVRDLDDEALVTAVLKAYVEATGDRYAEYFTADEYEAQIADQNGEMCGVGISVINGTVTNNGVIYQALIIANVYPDSPASEAGVLPGDAIMAVGAGDEAVMVNDIGYTETLARLRGEEGTIAVFSVWRETRSADGAEKGYEELPFTVTRRKITAQSVLFHVCATDSRVGVVRLTGFDNTTAPQFETAMNSLLESGCTSFVIDLRNNGGGLLSSVEDVATFWLKPDDVMLYTRNKGGEKKTYTVTVSNGKVTSGSGQYKEEDVGKYADYPVAVLVNEHTASAAELLTAVIRDHQLGTVIGTTTYGKGTMQTTYPLSRYGYDGALKLTTQYYDPPCGESYDGVGITPDVRLELSEEALTYNINLLPDDKDNQLMAAVALLHP